MRTYSINTIDSETTPAWMSIAAKVTPTTQDCGKCRYDVTVAAENEKALLAALDADGSVIDYVETITEEQEAEIIAEGIKAIEIAEDGQMVRLMKYADPIEDAREDLSPSEARDVAAEDPSLIYAIRGAKIG